MAYPPAKFDFQPIPANSRQNPPRVKSVPARLYIDKFVEHREAYDFLQEMQNLHGEGVKTIVRSLIYYRDSVIIPLSQRSNPSQTSLSDELVLRARLDFQPVPARQRKSPGRVRHVSVRMYIDKYLEHRAAYEFIRDVQRKSGEGNKTIVRALLHYQEDLS